jgi:hypothetical protein
MKYLTVFAALLLCSSGQAATYVYQANAYQGYRGSCGEQLLPFQMTITVDNAFPPNSKFNDAPLQAIWINAGGKYQWGYHASKKRALGGSFVTNSNGDITEWAVGAAKSARKQAFTHNETGSVEDLVEFNCGSAGVDGDPGAWTRTE